MGEILRRYNKPFFRVLSDKEVMKKLMSETGFPKDVIKQVVMAFNENLYNTAIENTDGVELPQQLGHIFIGACEKKRTSKQVDYVNTRKYGKVIEHRNLDTEGLTAKIFYTTHSNKYKYKNHALWGFSGHRSFTRATSAEFRKNYTRYIRINPDIKVASLYKTNIT